MIVSHVGVCGRDVRCVCWFVIAWAAGSLRRPCSRLSWWHGASWFVCCCHSVRRWFVAWIIAGRLLVSVAAIVAVFVVAFIAQSGVPPDVKGMAINMHVGLVFGHSPAISAALTLVGGFVASFVAPMFSTCWAPDESVRHHSTSCVNKGIDICWVLRGSEVPPADLPVGSNAGAHRQHS